MRKKLAGQADRGQAWGMSSARRQTRKVSRKPAKGRTRKPAVKLRPIKKDPSRGTPAPAMKRLRGGIAQMSKATIAAMFAQQRAASTQRQQREKAKAARDRFRVTKKDRGKVVFVGTKGQRNPQAKGRKGYLVYVTKTGKKWLVRGTGDEAFRAHKIKDVAPRISKTLKNKLDTFNKSRLVRVAEQKPVIRAEGKAKPEGRDDFSDKVVLKLARSIQKAMHAQASHRDFLITSNILVKLPDGTTRVFTVEVPIARADHISIKLGGLYNFVRQKFYKFMAMQLSFHGFVTRGSANHIRRLTANQGLPKEEWINKQGDAWFGREDTETVRIQTIEWKIEQAQ